MVEIRFRGESYCGFCKCVQFVIISKPDSAKGSSCVKCYNCRSKLNHMNKVNF